MEDFNTQIKALLAIFDEKQPIKQDGTFSPEAVKETALAMADYIVDEKESLPAFKDWMESHEFWTSPASTRFHGNVKGGLAAHSLLVAVQALRFAIQHNQNSVYCVSTDETLENPKWDRNLNPIRGT